MVISFRICSPAFILPSRLVNYGSDRRPFVSPKLAFEGYCGVRNCIYDYSLCFIYGFYSKVVRELASWMRAVCFGARDIDRGGKVISGCK